GVMDGAMSDLRTGLPWQMVEIHEPVRLLFVVETTATAMLLIMAQNAAIDLMVRKRWVQVALQDPKTGQLSLFQQDAFVPYRNDVEPLPVAPTSLAWYGGWRERLEFAEISAGIPA
ncbi:MAG: putative inorganic carbon transporter subunit DabA, partial [Pseudohongiellaceae bacterium]